MRSLWSLGLVWVLLLGGVAPLSAAESCGPYTVLLYEFGQLNYRNAHGQPQGVDPDLVEALARRSGCQLLTAVDSRVRIWDQLARGTLEITTSGIATPEREQLAEFWPYLRSRNRAVMRTAQAGRWASLADFAADPARRVAVVKGFKHGPSIDAFLDRMRAERRVDEVGGFDTAYRVLMAGRVDLIFAHPLNLPAITPGSNAAVTLLDWAPQDDILACLVVSRTRVAAADRQRLREALTSLLRDGSVDAIMARHVRPELLASLRLPSPR
ncbi:MAG: substrate-binding periplasmic protein [Roseateles sp.]